MFRHESRRQMSVYFENQQTVIQSTPVADFSFGFTETVIQSTPMVDFSFGFTERSFSLFKGQKHLRSLADDLISNKQKRSKRIY